MIARRPGPGELVAGAGGALLLVATFLPWFAVDTALRLPHRAGGTTIRGEGVSAWQAFAVLDVLLLITALAAIALLVLRAADVASTRVPVALVTAVAGVVCAALVVYRLLDPPDLPVVEGVGSEVGRRIGAFFALLATAAISWGAFRALAPESAAAEREPARERRPEPERAPEPEPEPELAPIPEPEPEPEPPARVTATTPRPTRARDTVSVTGPRARPPGPPVRSAGVAAFEDLISELEPTLDRLWKAPAHPRAEHTTIPARPGVYLFTRRDEAVHVGQAENLNRRLAEQCRPSSGHTRATLAFAVARRAARGEGLDVDGPPARLATSDAFVPFFDRAKEAVAALPVRFLEVESPELRTLFAVYGSMALGTSESATDGSS